MPHEYLVNIHIQVPASLPPSELDELRRRERDTAQHLAATGHLVRLWRVPGEWANWGLWRAENETELEALLSTLPLRPFMRITVHPTGPHPSDPLATGQ
ncbi:muconolactone Delta-isomerase family protein [Amycolatopsis pithecellobii]|uniref:Muconolactone Delta-isomerase n=1 Tax=Amycolatopsis pithecellobii TaxID=664692 RepID=A0A6N7YI75_9PSEU|nr:muconolactone Delta-isomerase family protein [Amycolatopsis pithecellobii]MTD52607.1 muconolactone delta-isomerase [Amycolatopsis pithecellobii]